MKNSALRYLMAEEANKFHLPLTQLEFLWQGWKLHMQISDLSEATIALRESIMDNLIWFLRDRSYKSLTLKEIREFLMYLAVGHTDLRGRWGNPQMKKPVTRRTRSDYHKALSTFFEWALTQGHIRANPMIMIDLPPHQEDQIKPFNDNQLIELKAAAAKSDCSKRDVLIWHLLFDTGIRATELCTIIRADVDLSQHSVTVLGKGEKMRTVYFGVETTQALWDYLFDNPINPDEPLIQAERGKNKGQALNRHSLGDVIERWGKRAGFVDPSGKGVRVSPHTFRHSFATQAIRDGAHAYTVQESLGHTTSKQTRRYVHLTQADTESMRRHSPADKLKKRSRK